MNRMSCRTAVPVLALVAVAACTDRGLPTEVTRVAPAPAADWVDGQYPTTDDFYAQGGSLPGIVGINAVSSAFSGDLSTWGVSGEYHYQFANDLDVLLSSKILTSSGGTINSGTSNDGSFHRYLPVLLPTTQIISLDLSTSNNFCGITGKGELAVSADVKLTNPVTGVTQNYWADSKDQHASDVSLADCQPLSPCGTEIVDDGSCNDGSTGGPSAGGGGGSGGGNCTEWAVYEEVSYDGGVTWQFDGIDYYYWVC